MRIRSTVTVLLLALALASTASASQNPVVTDCYSHGRLVNTYPAAELRSALQTMPATVKEYTSCQDIIESALLRQVGQGGKGNGPGSSSGGSFLPAPVIVVLVLLALTGVTFGAIAIRRRSDGTATGTSRES
jgi:hypothetical protein